MINDTKEFGIGLALITGFFVALFAIFSPLFEGGKNALDYLDGTFNSVSKDSAYYIPGITERARKHDGTAVTLSIKAADDKQAARMAKLFTTAGASVALDSAQLSISGDLGKILAAVLADADLMFKNEGATVSGKYGIEEKRVLHDWHMALAAMNKDLNKQEKFKEAKTVRDIQTKAVEPAYNYYGIKAIPMSSMIWVSLSALLGYVFYTIWYGFAILFLFEGWGLKLNH
jgi:hypothetical protein